MKRFCLALLLAVSLLVSGSKSPAQNDARVRETARKIHFSSIVLDTHINTTPRQHAGRNERRDVLTSSYRSPPAEGLLRIRSEEDSRRKHLATPVRGRAGVSAASSCEVISRPSHETNSE